MPPSAAWPVKPGRGQFLFPVGEATNVPVKPGRGQFLFPVGEAKKVFAMMARQEAAQAAAAAV